MFFTLVNIGFSLATKRLWKMKYLWVLLQNQLKEKLSFSSFFFFLNVSNWTTYFISYKLQNKTKKKNWLVPPLLRVCLVTENQLLLPTETEFHFH